MIFIFLLLIYILKSALLLCPKAIFEGTEYHVETEEGKVQKQCKTRHIFNKEGVKYCLKKETEGIIRSSIACGELQFPRAEKASSKLSKCTCDQSGYTKMEVGIAGGEDETDPKWTVMLTGSNKGWPPDSLPPIKERSFCTGSLLTHTAVLTAAHCMYAEYLSDKHFYPEEMKDVKPFPNSEGFGQVLVGMVNVNNMENVTIHEIEEFWVHPGYRIEPYIEVWQTVGDNHFFRSKHQDDIAVIRIAKMDIKYYNPICLPPRNDDIYADVCVKITGWGRGNETDLVTQPDILQGLKTMTITIKECRTMWKDAKFMNDLMVDVFIKDTINICPAGILGKSTCTGDSGGPMAFTIKEKNESTSYIIGVMSFGPHTGCGSKEPHVLTRVSHYVDWIRTKMDGEQPPRCRKYWSSESCACC